MPRTTIWRVVGLGAALMTAHCSTATEGPAGENGQRGSPGTNGTNGAPGINGADGASGADGAPGAPGADGAAGTTGALGATGATGPTGAAGAGGFARRDFVVVRNPASGTKNISLVDESFGVWKSFTTDGGNEGAWVDASGVLYVAGDTMQPGRIQVISRPREAAPPGPAGIVQRTISGASTGLVNVKGLTGIDSLGLLIAANNDGAGSAQAIGVYATGAAGDAPALFSLPLPSDPWDMVYDAIGDQLFVALVNGELRIYDAFVTDAASAAFRTVVPVDADGTTKTSSNLHGIDYDAATDRLVVTDVGAATTSMQAGFDTDGSIYVFSDVSSPAFNGNVIPSRVIEGGATFLGNPVDCILDGSHLRVAEKANGGGRLLLFANVMNAADGNVAPALNVLLGAPEALAWLPPASNRRDLSDLTSADAISFLAFTTNADDAPTNRNLEIKHLANLDNTFANFDLFTVDTESAAFDVSGDAYVTFRISGTDRDRAERVARWRGDAYVTFRISGTESGIQVLHRASTGKKRPLSQTSGRDRRIQGAATTLFAAKGIELIQSKQLIVVADTGDGAGVNAGVKVFSMSATGDVAPLWTTDAGGRPWDMDYDVASDTLYVALTNGNVAVFERFVKDRPLNTPTRLIDVDGGINLHGIVYNGETDTLLLSDVGLAGDTTDGKLFLVINASSVDGAYVPDVTIASPATLGNPVDIAFNGEDLFVAEKASGSGSILRYPQFMSLSSGDVAAETLLSGVRVESITLLPSTLQNR